MQPASELSVAGLLQIHAPITWRNPDAVFSQPRIVSEHSVDGVHEQVEVDVREVGMFDGIGVHLVGVGACGTWIVEVVEYGGLILSIEFPRRDSREKALWEMVGIEVRQQMA